MKPSKEPRIFAFLDVDRCLLDTEKAFDVVREVTDQNTSVSKSMIDEAYAEHKQEGKSFNVTGFIESKLQEDELWEVDILPDFVRRGRGEGLLMPHGKEFISRLGELGIDYGLLTYGSWSNNASDPDLDRDRSIKWQVAKIAADPALANIPGIVTHTPRKTEYITNELVGRKPGKKAKIILPTEYTEYGNAPKKVDHAIMVDDKLIAHEDGDPDVIRGVLVTPEGMRNRNNHHKQDDKTSIAGLKRVVGLKEAADAVEEIASEFRSK